MSVLLYLLFAAISYHPIRCMRISLHSNEVKKPQNLIEDGSEHFTQISTGPGKEVIIIMTRGDYTLRKKC